MVRYPFFFFFFFLPRPKPATGQYITLLHAMSRWQAFPYRGRKYVSTPYQRDPQMYRVLLKALGSARFGILFLLFFSAAGARNSRIGPYIILLHVMSPWQALPYRARKHGSSPWQRDPQTYRVPLRRRGGPSMEGATPSFLSRPENSRVGPYITLLRVMVPWQVLRLSSENLTSDASEGAKPAVVKKFPFITLLYVTSNGLQEVFSGVEFGLH